MVTAANGAIVSCPAMISPAVAALNCGSPPHARAASDDGEDGAAGAVGGGAVVGTAASCGTASCGAASCGAASCGATAAGRGRIGDGVRAGGSTACAAEEPATPPKVPSA